MIGYVEVNRGATVVTVFDGDQPVEVSRAVVRGEFAEVVEQIGWLMLRWPELMLFVEALAGGYLVGRELVRRFPDRVTCAEPKALVMGGGC